MTCVLGMHCWWSVDRSAEHRVCSRSIKCGLCVWGNCPFKPNLDLTHTLITTYILITTHTHASLQRPPDPLCCPPTNLLSPAPFRALAGRGHRVHAAVAQLHQEVAGPARREHQAKDDRRDSVRGSVAAGQLCKAGVHPVGAQAAAQAEQKVAKGSVNAVVYTLRGRVWQVRFDVFEFILVVSTPGPRS